MLSLHLTLAYLLTLWSVVSGSFHSSNVLFAVNCGGRAHTDVHGVKYRADPISDGVASDYGARYAIHRVDPQDAILYQTERYHFEDFSYDIPLPTDDGIYTLVLKFAEVYFQSAGRKVFDVLLNDATIIPDLDIWKVAGGVGVAYDKSVSFKVKGKTVYIDGEAVDVSKGFKLTFAKGTYDNPKINAFYLYKGPESEIPQLHSLPEVEEEEVPESPVDVEMEEEPKKPKFAEGPPVDDPYAQQDSSYILVPILVAIACFFPILYCLCKM